MVEQLTIDGEHVVGLAVVLGDPVGVHLRRAIRRARVELGLLVLRRRGSTEHLAGRRLVEANARIRGADRLKHVQGADAGGLGRVGRLVERDAHVRLGREVVDLLRVDLPHQLLHAGGIGDVAVVQMEVLAGDVVVMVQVVDARPIEGAGPANDAVHLVALVQQLLGHVRAVLTGHARDERTLRLRHRSSCG